MELYEYARPGLFAGKKIMYVHGFASSGASGTVGRIRLLLPQATVKRPASRTWRPSSRASGTSATRTRTRSTSWARRTAASRPATSPSTIPRRSRGSSSSPPASTRWKSAGKPNVTTAPSSSWTMRRAARRTSRRSRISSTDATARPGGKRRWRRPPTCGAGLRRT